MPGPPAGGNGLSLAEAIVKIPAADENRTGYKRDSFKHWIDEDGDSCSTRAALEKLSEGCSDTVVKYEVAP